MTELHTLDAASYVDHLVDTGQLQCRQLPANLVLRLGAGLAPRRWRRSTTPFGELAVARDETCAVLSTSVAGAPGLAALVEMLECLGVRRLVTVGRAGGLGFTPTTPEVFAPPAAFGDDGVTAAGGERRPVRASPELVAQLGYDTRRTVWTTDTPFGLRGSRQADIAAAGATLVDMEASAVFATGRRLGIDAAAALVVSDGADSVRWAALEPGVVLEAIDDAVQRAVASLGAAT